MRDRADGMCEDLQRTERKAARTWVVEGMPWRACRGGEDAEDGACPQQKKEMMK